MKKNTGVAEGYVHGFTKEEQIRLYQQARFLEPSLYSIVDFSQSKHLIEVGCGVGAQTEILLERFPHLQITGVDASEVQLARARTHLTKAIAAGKVKFTQADALRLPFADHNFDGAFLCWILEHVNEPVGILREAKRVLQKNALIHCVEVFNHSFYTFPACASMMRYWQAYNDFQASLHADPNVGPRVASHLQSAGFTEIQPVVRSHFYDTREPQKRSQFIKYWETLLLSGAPQMIKTGLVTSETVETMKHEFAQLAQASDSVVFYSWVQTTARA